MTSFISEHVFLRNYRSIYWSDGFLLHLGSSECSSLPVTHKTFTAQRGQLVSNYCNEFFTVFLWKVIELLMQTPDIFSSVNGVVNYSCEGAH